MDSGYLVFQMLLVLRHLIDDLQLERKKFDENCIVMRSIKIEMIRLVPHLILVTFCSIAKFNFFF